MPPLLAALAAVLLCVAFWAWRGRDVVVADAPSSRLPCVSYAPFRGSQSPFDEGLVIAPAQIESDLGTLARMTGCVRIYAVDQGLAAVPAIAERLGLQVLLGAWLGRDPERNAEEISAVVSLANRYPRTIRSVIVGNEVLLRRELPPARLIQHIREVSAAVPVPVSYADVWEFWLEHPEVAEAVDVLTIHILPYWEDRPVAVEAAVDHVGAVLATIRRAFPGKPILIGEVGWPSRGRMRERALPGPANQARFVRETLAMAAREAIAINLMEGIDQPWKRRLEGTVGGFWGILDEKRRAKFPLSGPVVAEPAWAPALATSGAGALLAILWAGSLRLRLRPLGWAALALVAAAAASSLVQASLELSAAGRGALGWAIGISQLAVTAGSLALTAHVLLSGPRVAPTAAYPLIEKLRRRRPRGIPTPADALGWLRLLTLFGLAATSLCLAFDGRYRDLPTAAYAPAVTCFLVLAWLNRAADRSGQPREEAALAAIAVAAAGAVLVTEGTGNHQALAWAGVVIAAAAIPALELLPRRALLEPDRAQGGEEECGGAELGVVEDERRGSGSAGRQDDRPA